MAPCGSFTAHDPPIGPFAAHGPLDFCHDRKGATWPTVGNPDVDNNVVKSNLL